MENGKWKMENGEWKMENGKWRMENGEWRMENGEWRMENGECLKGEIKLGKVKDIERVDVDYLIIQTDKKLVNKGFPKRFLIDFKRHVKDVDIEQKKITARNAIDILESLK